VSFVLEVKLRVKPESVEDFMARLAQNAKGARAEPGCKTFDVSVDPNDRTSVMLYEVYADERAFEAHQQTAHFRKYLAEAVPLLASRERRIWRRV
jgi:quinol monooxygenase YgiN